MNHTMTTSPRTKATSQGQSSSVPRGPGAWTGRSSSNGIAAAPGATRDSTGSTNWTTKREVRTPPGTTWRTT